MSTSTIKQPQKNTYVMIDVGGKTLDATFNTNYPTGFSYNNCHLGNVSYLYGGNNYWYTIAEAVANDANLKIIVRMDSGGIKVTPKGQYCNWGGSKLAVELVKY